MIATEIRLVHAQIYTLQIGLEALLRGFLNFVRNS